MNDESAIPNFPVGGEQERFAQAAVSSQRAWRAVCPPAGSNCQGTILSAQQLHTEHTPARGREQQRGNGRRPPGPSPGGATACGRGGGTCESPWPRVARGGRAGARPQQPLPRTRRGHWGCAQDRPQPPGPETPSADSPTAQPHRSAWVSLETSLQRSVLLSLSQMHAVTPQQAQAVS